MYNVQNVLDKYSEACASRLVTREKYRRYTYKSVNAQKVFCVGKNACVYILEVSNGNRVSCNPAPVKADKNQAYRIISKGYYHNNIDISIYGIMAILVKDEDWDRVPETVKIPIRRGEATNNIIMPAHIVQLISNGIPVYYCDMTKLCEKDAYQINLRLV